MNALEFGYHKPDCVWISGTATPKHRAELQHGWKRFLLRAAELASFDRLELSPRKHLPSRATWTYYRPPAKVGDISSFRRRLFCAQNGMPPQKHKEKL